MTEDVVGLQRELLLRPDEMKVAVAGAGRQLQFRFGIVAVDPWRERTRGGRVHCSTHSCTLMLAFCMTLVHFTVSSARNLVNSSGVLPRASEPSWPSLSATDFFSSAVRIAALSFSTTAGGVP